MSLIYIPFIIFGPALIVSALLHLHYFELDEVGIHTTTFGRHHKAMPWADIKAIALANRYGTDGVAIKFNNIDKASWLKRYVRNRIGYDGFIMNWHKPDGSSLTNDIINHFGQLQ